MRLFGRRWRVQVGELLLSELDVTFKATRAHAARPGTLELEIYNPTEAHRRELTSATAGQTFVEVQAGYLEGMSTIFRGDVRKAVAKRDGVEWVTTITGGDGEHAILSSRLSRSFASGSTVETVVRALADAMGVGVGNAATALRAARAGGAEAFTDGTLLRGLAAGELTRLCESAGLTWSVQEGALLLLPLGGAIQRTALRLAADTGLLGSPEESRSGHAKARALLIPDLVPGRLVELDSATLRGTYRIETAEYAGDTRGDDWHADLTLRART